jgi:hypothetical protein
MRKILLILSCITLTPVLFIFTLVVTLFIYRNNYLYKLTAFNRDRNLAYAALPTTQNIFSADISEEDGRVEHVRQFFARYGSPLEPYAQNIVDTADNYGLDFRLLPAIAMQESNLCHKIPDNSFNCWGFGIYGGKVTRFTSYPEAIETVSKTLSQKYKTRGLVTPDQIVTMWNPSNTNNWAFSVNHFMSELQ